MSAKNIDVLIVGAGPVGLFCANELTRHGLSCRIIDKKSAPSTQSKALGLHIRTLAVFEDCGFINQILAQGHKIEGIKVKSQGKTLINAEFDSIKAERDYLIDLPQDQTEGILERGLISKGLIVEWNTELTHLSQSLNEITATVKKSDNKIELLNASWLIACDGAHSTVRHQLEMEFKGSAYEQNWWLADLLIDWATADSHMTAYLSDRGPLACFPMGNKRYRIVMTAPKDASPTPTLADISAEFKLRCTDAAVLSNPIWITPFSIHHRQIQHYQNDRVFFAGDAAHIHSPMGGQGLNTGIQDIYNLAWKLALVEKKQAKAELLASYQHERFPVGQEVLKQTDIMTRMILLKNPLLIALRNRFIKLLNTFDFLKKKIVTNLAELSISYAKSPIVHESGSTRILKAGIYLPEFELLNTVNQKMESSRELTQGTKHHLFIFTGLKKINTDKISQLANSLAAEYSDSLMVHFIVVAEHMPDTTNKAVNLLLDTANVQQQFGVSKPTLLLVRPDKYIGIIQQPINEKKFAEQLYLVKD